MHTPLIIIGAGPGGYETAVEAAAKGLQVVIIEKNHVGGTCLNEGCIPTKALCASADAVRTVKESESYGITTEGYSVNFQQVIDRKNTVVSTLRQGVEGLLKNKLITLVYGEASFVDARTVRVAHAQNAAGESVEETYTADHIIIATGSVTKFLPIEGAHLPGVVTSTELLDIDHIPTRLCIIGGGVIGLEFASIFNTMGSEVTVVEYCKEILPPFDSDIAKRLRLALKAQGIQFLTGAAVNGIQQTEDGLAVSYELKGTTETIPADTVLMAVGRAPRLEGLNLVAAGIATDRRGIVVDDRMQTSVPHIYAIGDVNGRMMLAHVATFQGKRALATIQGEADQIRLDIVPAAVFTHPEAAMVGVTEDTLKAQGQKPQVKKAFFRANGKSLAMGETEGMVKILADETGKILGCHLFGPHSADLVQEVAALMNHNATLSEAQSIIHGHPTLGEVIQTALHS